MDYIAVKRGLKKASVHLLARPQGLLCPLSRGNIPNDHACPSLAPWGVEYGARHFGSEYRAVCPLEIDLADESARALPLLQSGGYAGVVGIDYSRPAKPAKFLDASPKEGAGRRVGLEDPALRGRDEDRVQARIKEGVVDCLGPIKRRFRRAWVHGDLGCC